MASIMKCDRCPATAAPVVVTPEHLVAGGDPGKLPEGWNLVSVSFSPSGYGADDTGRTYELCAACSTAVERVLVPISRSARTPKAPDKKKAKP